MADIAHEAKIIPDEPVLAGLSKLLSFLWDVTWQHAAGTQGGDADALHDMRVATRRLRSALQNFEGSKDTPLLGARRRNELQEQRRELGKLGDALGVVRDHDVLDDYLKKYARRSLKRPLEECAGLVAFERFLQDERAAAFKPMIKRISKSSKDGGLREHFARFALGLPAAHAPSLTLREAAHLILPQRVDEVLLHAPALNDPHGAAEQHELRKSLRRLRYTFETLGPCFADDVKPHIKTLVKLQDLLGEIQDRTVLHAKALEAFDVDQGDVQPLLSADVAEFLQYGRRRRQRLLNRVRKLWHAHQENGFFESLCAL